PQPATPLLHDALPICAPRTAECLACGSNSIVDVFFVCLADLGDQRAVHGVDVVEGAVTPPLAMPSVDEVENHDSSLSSCASGSADRKSTRLNSSHRTI